jgi:hypothetical protein
MQRQGHICKTFGMVQSLYSQMGGSHVTVTVVIDIVVLMVVSEVNVLVTPVVVMVCVVQ